MKIGELARLAGCQTVTIRYYEKEGLLPGPERSAGNYRIYGKDDLERLQFIRQCRICGISLAAIRQLLDFRDHPRGSCLWINALVDEQLGRVNSQIADLEHLKRHLEALRKKCDGKRSSDCGILEGLRHLEICPECQKSRI